MDHEGHILHARVPHGEDRPDLQRLGGPRTNRFSVVEFAGDPGGVLVSALTGNRALHLLHWADFPKGRPNRRWQDHGLVDDLRPMRPIDQHQGVAGQPALALTESR